MCSIAITKSWLCRRQCELAMAVLMVLFSICIEGGVSIQCHCSNCPDPMERGHLWPTCETVDGACYTKVSESSGSPLLDGTVLRGCVAREDIARMCGRGLGTTCCHSNRCNDGKPLKLGSRKLLQSETEMSSESVPGMSDNEKMIAIVTTSVCVVLITIFAALVLTFTTCCLYFYRGNHRTHARADVEAGRVIIGNCCSAIIPQGETISSLLIASHHPSSSSHHPANSSPSPSLSLLVQRSIVKNTALERLLEHGRFCDYCVGRWRREQVMVKIYSAKHEKLWFSETQIHQIPHMHHPHLLTFIGADYLQALGHLRHYLITEHHSRGSLSDYLREATLDVGATVVLSQSAASGLAHLHLEVKGSVVEKPAIVHRNISSKSFYVKNDGTCCLGDLSLAVKDDANFLEEVKGTPLGHTPYLSPEVLDAWSSQEPLSCDVLKKADVYALGLVIWEIARRCSIQGYIESAEDPFSAMVSSDHASLEEMRQLVCSTKLRPPMAEQWNLDESMQRCVQTMRECWEGNPAHRPSAMTTKNSLDKLLPSLKLTSKNAKC